MPWSRYVTWLVSETDCSGLLHYLQSYCWLFMYYSVVRWRDTYPYATLHSTCDSSSSHPATASTTTHRQSNSRPPRVREPCPRWLAVGFFTRGTDAGSCSTEHIGRSAGTVVGRTPRQCVDVRDTVSRSMTLSTCFLITSDQFAVLHHTSRFVLRRQTVTVSI